MSDNEQWRVINGLDLDEKREFYGAHDGFSGATLPPVIKTAIDGMDGQCLSLREAIELVQAAAVGFEAELEINPWLFGRPGGIIFLKIVYPPGSRYIYSLYRLIMFR